MKKSIQVLALMAVGLALLSTTGCGKLQARDQLNKGVQSFKNAKYEEAINHFQEAVKLDPTLLNARLYLATAYAQQYIPGADTPDNNKMAEQAIEAVQGRARARSEEHQQRERYRLPLPADEAVRKG